MTNIMTPRHNLDREPPYFFGREAIYNLVRSELLSTNQPIILKGFGGIGKSTIAKKIAYNCLEMNVFQVVVWLDIRQYRETRRIDLNSILDTISRVYDPNMPIVQVSDIQLKLENIIRILSRCSVLLIFDNFEGIIGFPEEKAICAFINQLPMAVSPPTHKDDILRVIVTSREMSRSLDTLQPKIHLVDKLDIENAKELIEQKFNDLSIKFNLEEQQQTRLYNLTHGIPKLIEFAVGQIRYLPFKEVEHSFEFNKPLERSDKIYGYLFYRAWGEILTEKHKQILMSMTYFVEHAPREALIYLTNIEYREFSRYVKDLCNMSLLEIDHLENNHIVYKMHPLTQKICEAELDNRINFYELSAKKFVDYYLEYCQKPYETNRSLLERETKNIIAAIKLAERLTMVESLIKFHRPVNRYLWLAGYWPERIDVNQSIIEAYRLTNNLLLEARILVEDIGFTYLRFEQLQSAEKYVRQGLVIFKEIGDSKGIALAKRHLGKSALLKAEYELVENNRNWRDYFEEAQTLYTSSLRIRKELICSNREEELSVADLDLDFGRLYCLWGRKSEREGRNLQRVEFISEALELYDKSIVASNRGLELFKKLHNQRGISKAMGNLGNVYKQHGIYYLEEGKSDEAFSEFEKARKFYNNSLEISQDINKIDEIAHAKWGLAEIYEFYVNNWEQVDKIDLAFELVQDSNLLYRRMATPADIRVTQDLLDRVSSRRSEIIAINDTLYLEKPTTTDQTTQKANRKGETPMLDTVAIPVLMKAVEFIFGEGSKILEERRKRRLSLETAEEQKGSHTKTASGKAAINVTSGVFFSREMVIDQPIEEAMWLSSKVKIEHLVSLLDTYTKNYYFAKEKYAKWGGASVPPIVMHELEEAEEGIAKNSQELQDALSKIYGKKVVKPEKE